MFAGRMRSAILVLKLMLDMRRADGLWSPIGPNTWERKMAGVAAYEIIIHRGRWFRCRPCDAAHLFVRVGNKERYEVPLGLLAGCMLRKALWGVVARRAATLRK